MDGRRDDELPLAEKLADAELAGFGVECTPEEAAALGAFDESAITLEDIEADLQDAEPSDA